MTGKRYLCPSYMFDALHCRDRMTYRQFKLVWKKVMVSLIMSISCKLDAWSRQVFYKHLMSQGVRAAGSCLLLLSFCLVQILDPRRPHTSLLQGLQNSILLRSLNHDLHDGRLGTTSVQLLNT